jgi:hypothetical protein
MKRLLIIIAIALLAIPSCKKKDGPLGVLAGLYDEYQHGEIDECRLNGQLVYCAGQNAYDAGSVIYDSTGRMIGRCNYAWGSVDSICGKLKSCETVYRCRDHITGNPFVDKYGLSN